MYMKKKEKRFLRKELENVLTEFLKKNELYESNDSESIRLESTDSLVLSNDSLVLSTDSLVLSNDQEEVKEEEVSQNKLVKGEEGVKEEKPVIEHLVISGGGIIGFSEYGALKQTNIDGRWHMDNIQSIYGTSIGSVLAVIITLGYDWPTLDDFVVLRPWHHVFPIELNTILSGIQNRGLFYRSHFDDVFKPLFSGKDLPLDITLEGYYEYTKGLLKDCTKDGTNCTKSGKGIDLHMFAVDVNAPYSVDVDFSYKTHPHMKLLDAVYASSSIPGIFSPLMTEDGACYMDGGIFKNYPLRACITGQKVDPRTILGFKRCVEHAIQNQRITGLSTLLDAVLLFIGKVGERINVLPELCEHIDNEVVIHAEPLNLASMLDVLKSAELRRSMIEKGAQLSL